MEETTSYSSYLSYYMWTQDSSRFFKEALPLMIWFLDVLGNLASIILFDGLSVCVWPFRTEFVQRTRPVRLGAIKVNELFMCVYIYIGK